MSSDSDLQARAEEVAAGLEGTNLKWMTEAANYLVDPNGDPRRKPTVFHSIPPEELKSLERLGFVGNFSLYLTPLGHLVAKAIKDPRHEQ